METVTELFLILHGSDNSKRAKLFKFFLEQAIVLFYSILVYDKWISHFDLIDFSKFQEIYEFFYSGRIFVCFGVYVGCFIVVYYSWQILRAFDNIFYSLGGKRIKFLKGGTQKFLQEYKLIKQQNGTIVKHKYFEFVYNVILSIYYLNTKGLLRNLLRNVALIINTFIIFHFFISRKIVLPGWISGVAWFILIYSIINQAAVYLMLRFLENDGCKVLGKMEGVQRFFDNHQTKVSNEGLRADSPIYSVIENALTGRDQYAKLLSNIISNYREKNALVISVNGEWGDGKTSLINMALEPLIYNAKEDKYVLFYNPWNFKDSERVTYSFLNELNRYLKRVLGIKYAEKIEGKFILYTRFIALADFNIDEAQALNENDIENLKGDIERELKKIDFKIIVVIDDIDRLNKAEIEEVFKLVKLVGDFPNIIYILPLDKRIMSNLGIDHEYLKKIIQMEIELPPITDKELINMTVKEVNKLLGSYKLKEIENDERVEVRTGYYRYVRNIRDINRLLNTLRFYLSSVEIRQLNMEDFVRISAINIFDPELYQFIASNKWICLYEKESLSTSLTKKDYAKEYTEKVEAALSGSKIGLSYGRELIADLFPSLRSLISYGFYKSEQDMATWRIEHRMCTKDFFDKYLLFPVKPEPLTKNEIESILNDSNDKSKFKNHLVKLCEQDKISFFIDRAYDYVGNSAILIDPITIAQAFLGMDNYITENLSNIPNSFWTIRGNVIILVIKLFKRYSALFDNKVLHDLIIDKENALNLIVEMYFSIFYSFQIEQIPSLDRTFVQEYMKSRGTLENNLSLTALQDSLSIRFSISFEEMITKNPKYIISWRALDKENTDIDKLVVEYINRSHYNFVCLFEKFKRLTQIVYSAKKIEHEAHFDVQPLFQIVDRKIVEEKIDGILKSPDSSLTEEQVGLFQENVKLYQEEKLRNESKQLPEVGAR